MVAPAIPLILEGILAASGRLAASSAGRYVARSVGVGVIDALASVEGRHPQSMNEAAQPTSGAAGAKLRLPTPGNFVMDLLVGIAGSMLAEKFSELLDCVREGVDGAEKAENETGRATDAIDALCEEAEQICLRIVATLRNAIDTICSCLSQMDPREHPAAFDTAVCEGADLIRIAQSEIIAICGARDEAICGCYERLIDATGSICDSLPPVPEIPDCPPEAATAPASAGAVAGGAGAVAGGAGAAVSGAVAGSVAGEASIGEAGDLGIDTLPSAATGSIAAAGAVAGVGSGGSASDNWLVSMGVALGVGILEATLNWIVGELHDCLNQDTPASEPEPEPQPAPALESEPEPEPAPEPPPPAGKLANMAPGSYSGPTPGAPTVGFVESGMSDPEAAELPADSSAAGTSFNVRKAGDW